uniref:Uncharacterized protein n=1 Tax=Caenorhabditis tropicalis TaxID=1561998 RepID=A0A1I7UQX7_9PELO
MGGVKQLCSDEKSNEDRGSGGQRLGRGNGEDGWIDEDDDEEQRREAVTIPRPTPFERGEGRDEQLQEHNSVD